MSRVRVSAGNVALEYEGDEEFSRSDALKFFQEFLEAAKATDVQVAATQNPAGSNHVSDNRKDLSVSTIAVRIGVKSGLDLILAASLYLELTLGRTSYDRKEILEAMRQAGGFYRQTYNNNLTSYLNSIERDQKLVKQASNKYCLSIRTKTELISRIG